MTTYYFVGAQSNIGGYGVLNRLGQTITLPEEVYRAVRTKVPLLTKEQFNSIGFSYAELLHFGNALFYDSASKEFLAKKDAALKLWLDGDQPKPEEKPDPKPAEEAEGPAKATE